LITPASVQKRLFAKAIDFGIILVFGYLPGPVKGAGMLIGFFYALLADGLPFSFTQGQSIGKKLMKIYVVGPSGRSNLKTSVIRNALVALVVLLMMIPFWGWILSVIVGVPFALVEISLMIRAPGRQRLGDVLAESEVLVK